MLRIAYLGLSSLSMLMVVATMGVGSYLWYQGYLTRETLQEIRDVVFEDQVIAPVEEEEPVGESIDDVMLQRVSRFIHMAAHESELSAIETELENSADTLEQRMQLLEKTQADFEQRLSDLDAQAESEGVEQARGILPKMRGPEAVEYLMGLDADHNVLLLKGLSEADIAKILKEFAAGDDATRRRGAEIFKAISSGEPKKSLIDAAAAPAP